MSVVKWKKLGNGAFDGERRVDEGAVSMLLFFMRPHSGSVIDTRRRLLSLLMLVYVFVLYVFVCACSQYLVFYVLYVCVCVFSQRVWTSC